MATKTFKIGLSNTDKQNMAQDVYERLIAMCFDEYDSTKTYNKGDFVVYENPSDTFKLYKCNSDNVTGAWDSSKWDLATFQDLVDDIESAVAFVNDKANVDGNYPTMTVGVADQLSPYDDESGDDQDEPFSFQATGTGNGTQPDFATGAIALMKEKQGNTVVVNQLFNTSNFIGTTTVNGITFTKNNNGSYTISGTIGSGENRSFAFIQSTSATPIKQGHGYILALSGNKNSNLKIESNSVKSYNTSSIATIKPIDTNTYYGGTWWNFVFSGNEGDTFNETVFPQIIDLTQWFNGDIPQDILDNPSNFFRYYQGSLAYNVGTLVNANGRYIKCIGMNQWDEVAEQGSISNAGVNESGQYLRSRNYISVVPNTQYYFKRPSTQKFYIYCYDANKNFVALDEGYSHLVYKTLSANNFLYRIPNNVCYIRFVCDSAYGTTYNNDISINLYYEDEARCLTYEPYEVLTNNDTGTEVLRQAGNVKDYKEPDGTIHRLVGSVDLGTLSWTYNSTYGFWQTNSITDFKLVASNVRCNAISSSYIARAWNTVVGDSSEINTIATENSASGRVIVRNGSSTTEPSGYLVYELATPTTEQGTPFSENLVIDDFGTMDFQGTNGVPQGNLIFYPVDYKAFIDTLYDYTEGTPSNIALKSDLASDKTELQGIDTQLLNAIGGTLRQCLCVKESLDFDNTDFVDLGDLTFGRATSYAHAFFYANLSNRKQGNNDNIVSTLYKTYNSVSSSNFGDLAPNMSIACEVDSISIRIFIRNDAYTDITTFKNAMKGVLLAYEKGDNL